MGFKKTGHISKDFGISKTLTLGESYEITQIGMYSIYISSSTGYFSFSFDGTSIINKLNDIHGWVVYENNKAQYINVYMENGVVKITNVRLDTLVILVLKF